VTSEDLPAYPGTISKDECRVDQSRPRAKHANFFIYRFSAPYCHPVSPELMTIDQQISRIPPLHCPWAAASCRPQTTGEADVGAFASSARYRCDGTPYLRTSQSPAPLDTPRSPHITGPMPMGPNCCSRHFALSPKLCRRPCSLRQGAGSDSQDPLRRR